MTQEDKELLILKDLCARLPYGVKVRCDFGLDGEITEISRTKNNLYYCKYLDCKEGYCYIESLKPYLFPLSSMSETQCYELAAIRSGFQDCWKYIKTPIPLSICNFEQIDWFHKNHFDYRGLIEKGLALDATNLNIY